MAETKDEMLDELNEVLEEVAAPLEDILEEKSGESEVNEPAVEAEHTGEKEESATESGTDMGEEGEDEAEAERMEISAEEHADNVALAVEVLQDVIDLAAEGKLPERQEHSNFDLRATEGSMYFLEVIEEQEKEMEGPEEERLNELPSIEVLSAEAEEVETAGMQEETKRRQQLLAEFDEVHDEAQALRLMSVLLQSKIQRMMHRKAKPTAGASSVGTQLRNTIQASMVASLQADIDSSTTGIEDFTKELAMAEQVRQQLDQERNRGASEGRLKERLDAARQRVVAAADAVELLQGKALARMRVRHAQRKEAERIMKRVWPQLQRVGKERLQHRRALHQLTSAKNKVKELESFGVENRMATYEQLMADGLKLAERVQERSEQLATLNNVAERDLQQAASLREALQGAREAAAMTRTKMGRSMHYQNWARGEVLTMKQKRDELHKENAKLTRQLKLLAYPQLFQDHERVRQRLQTTQAELEKLRTSYAHQEKNVSAAREMLLQRSGDLKLTAEQSLFTMLVSTKCGPSHPPLEISTAGQASPL